MMNRRGQMFTDVLLFIVMTLIILSIVGMYLFMGTTIEAELKQSMPQDQFVTNVTETVDNTMGMVNTAYDTLKWSTVIIIMGMIFGIFIGSYMVTTRPIFFVPYIFVMIIAIIVSTGVSNAYQELISTPMLSSTFAELIGGNYIMIYLPLWVTIIGFVGGIIMFARMKSQDAMVNPYG